MDPLLLQGGDPSPSALLAGRYRLLGHIGAGGMATIYRARDEVLDRDVAVKVLHPHLATDPAVRERFRAEARAAAALVSPHVVNVFDSGADDRPFIVQEYVDGPSLRQVLTTRGRLSPPEALAVLEPVCAGLSRAHSRGLVHRDVKPENVLVTTDGVVKVADFGLVRAVEEAGHTTSGSLMASVHYVAPELVRGEAATPASDQYAVGVLLYELVTGRQPFPADGPAAAIALRHTRETVPPPSAAVPGLTAALDAVVAKATAPVPRDRYPDLQAFLAALRDAVPEGPEPVLVPGSSPRGNGTLVIPRETLDTTAVPAEALEVRPRFARGAWRKRVPRPRIGRLLALLLVTLLLLAGGAWLAYDQVIAPARLVPALANMQRDEAVAMLRDLGLVAQFGDPVTSREVPADAVLAMDPQPGTLLRRGEPVRLTLSSGPVQVAMPRVLELSRTEALNRLQGPPYHFTVRVDPEFSDTVPAEIVQAQFPQPDALVAEGAPVIINVSQGVEQVEVPDLVGRTRQEAERLLADADLEGEFTDEPTNDEPPGEVLSQDVDEGDEVEVGSTVEVTVAVAAVQLSMPDVRNQPIDAAVAVLEGLELEVDVDEREVPAIGPIPLAPLGDVREQLPAPGQIVFAGDEVQLVTFVRD